MKCQKCGKHDATMHITEIINGIKNETYLCKYCGDEYNQNSAFHSIFKNNADSFFDDFWKSPASLNQPGIKACPNCKITIKDIQSLGRLGCSECYSTFRDFLIQSFKNIHGSYTYAGKSPKRSIKFDKIEQLKQELNHAVENQDFERAAELRDEIKGMEA